ncbi:uncharacterized [Tachysurus ichikawai]
MAYGRRKRYRGRYPKPWDSVRLVMAYGRRKRYRGRYPKPWDSVRLVMAYCRAAGSYRTPPRVWGNRPIPEQSSFRGADQSHSANLFRAPLGLANPLRVRPDAGRGVAEGVVWDESRNKACITGCTDTARAQVSPPPSAGIVFFIIFIVIGPAA